MAGSLLAAADLGARILVAPSSLLVLLLDRALPLWLLGLGRGRERSVRGAGCLVAASGDGAGLGRDMRLRSWG